MHASYAVPDRSRQGALMAMAAMVCVQTGLAVSVTLIDRVGAEGAAWLRLVWAGAIMLLLARPWRARLTRAAWGTAVGLGVATAAVTLFFMAAVARLPLGTASAIEFLGPLGVAVARGRGTGRFVWPVLAAVGVLLLTRPWAGSADPAGVAYALAAACCWAAYILLTQRVGDRVSGLTGLGISMPVAALVATLTVGPSVVGRMTPELLLAGLGLAVLLPVVPFSLEMLALRRLSTAAFGTLMSLEPAFAMLVGLVVLAQVPAAPALVGVAFVVAAGIGAERSGSRSADAAAGEPLDEVALEEEEQHDHRRDVDEGEGHRGAVVGAELPLQVEQADR
ncbi:inner membrane transporter RhtA [Microlunatus sagamiharensis]|uniref:Inner membrane transporter RhtA n=1 Tax=Microlunatus sagamiharensis TaxID=546874 RepID=A0A1H2LMT5_9ACTN|nr:EamA family transporter [Microlunatus sagamiharensis]SDU82229.1 inner membrane transporter RhtA [Microlunatus sagamiharensis]